MSKYKDWENKLKILTEAYTKELHELRTAKAGVFNEKSDNVQKVSGKFIHDDQRIILSAPEIIIGNVNMGGMLNPDGKGNLIIRGNNVFMEGVGNGGQLAMRAPIISQIAEDPGIDGEEHVVSATSKIVSQAKEITIESNAVSDNGVFLAPDATPAGGVSIRADKEVSINATESKKAIVEKAKKVTDAWAEQTGKETYQDKMNGTYADFENACKEIEELINNRDKLDSNDPNAIRTSYRDMDELNIRIEELSLLLAEKLYKLSREAAKLAEGERQAKYFKKLQEDKEKESDDDFKKRNTGTTVSISSEKINLTTADGDGNMRTNADAGVKVNANSVCFDGVYTQEGELENTNKLSVNMRNISVTSESKTNSKRDDQGNINKVDYTSVGSVVIRSKDILLETTDHELADKKYKEKGLTANGSINLHSKTINLSTVNSSDVEVDEKGKTTKATYTPEGDIRLFSKTVSVESVSKKQEGDKTEETELTKDGLFSVRAENFAVSATDKEGKAAGKATINAKEIYIYALDVDPKTREGEQIAKGGKVEVVGEEAVTYSSSKTIVFSEKSASLLSMDTVSVDGSKLAEVKQDSALLQLSGGKAVVSSSENTLKGKTIIKVLESPSITVDNLTASKAIKAPNLTDGVMVDVKDTSPASAKTTAEEIKDPAKGLTDKAAASTDVDNALAAQLLEDLLQRKREELLRNN